MTQRNPLGLRGIDFAEFASPDITRAHEIFTGFGFSKLKRFGDKKIFLYKQNGINLLLNDEPKGFAATFAKQHGPSICSMGWRVDDAKAAHDKAVRLGAHGAKDSDKDLPYPAIYGIGESLIYFIDRFQPGASIYDEDFVALSNPHLVTHKGFLEIDHLTNNVPKGTTQKWATFYKDVFGFTEVRTFDIKGEKTGLVSYALRSPCGSFCIPINEGDSEKSQIEEFLRDYNGPGIQHLAFTTGNILGSLEALKDAPFKMLDPDASYYETAFDNFERVMEDKDAIIKNNVLIDGADDSYLLQLFTENLFGPIFIEIIQRVNNDSFGEGNFLALFKTIERDQMRRGTV